MRANTGPDRGPGGSSAASAPRCSAPLSLSCTDPRNRTCRKASPSSAPGASSERRMTSTSAYSCPFVSPSSMGSSCSADAARSRRAPAPACRRACSLRLSSTYRTAPPSPARQVSLLSVVCTMPSSPSTSPRRSTLRARRGRTHQHICMLHRRRCKIPRRHVPACAHDLSFVRHEELLHLRALHHQHLARRER